MKVDVEGNVYCGGAGGIWVMDSAGKKLGRIVHGAPATTNLAFGGDDWRTLYITSRNHLGAVKVKIPGIAVPVAAKWRPAPNPASPRFRPPVRGTERCYGAGGGGNGNFVAAFSRWSAAMPQLNDLSRSLVALDQNSTIIAVVELSHSSWLVAGVLPGIWRQPRKKLEPSPERLLALLHRWRDEAVRAGRTITRIALAFEAGHDGFWLARWLEARGVEAHVIHASSLAVSREHRRAKTDRLDTELLKRGFLGWLRGERGHCSMARVPTIAEEDAKRPNRERDCLWANARGLWTG
jgi:hypothetical protein